MESDAQRLVHRDFTWKRKRRVKEETGDSVDGLRSRESRSNQRPPDAGHRLRSPTRPPGLCDDGAKDQGLRVISIGLADTFWPSTRLTFVARAAIDSRNAGSRQSSPVTGSM